MLIDKRETVSGFEYNSETVSLLCNGEIIASEDLACIFRHH